MLTPAQLKVANGLFTLARQAGLPPQRASEFVAAAYAESGLNPHAHNPSGADGLFQLLSPGYRSKAQSLGGVTNPEANAKAILPDYLSFWRTHPNAAPGEAGAAVERSGEGAGFYASPLAKLGRLGKGSLPPAEALPIPSAGSVDHGTPMRNFALELIHQSQNLEHGMPGGLDAGSALGALKGDGQQPAEPTPTPFEPGIPGFAGDHGHVVVGPSANRGGMTLRAPVLSMVKRISAIYGKPLTIGTGTNHNEFVQGTNRVSDHWDGNAADIPSSGEALTRLGQAALVAAGVNPAQARKTRGGLFNFEIGGHHVQIIFNTNEGGNHFNHLHVGVR